jgi:hypothetical protein
VALADGVGDDFLDTGHQGSWYLRRLRTSLPVLADTWQALDSFPHIQAVLDGVILPFLGVRAWRRRRLQEVVRRHASAVVRGIGSIEPERMGLPPAVRRQVQTWIAAGQKLRRRIEPASLRGRPKVDATVPITRLVQARWSAGLIAKTLGLDIKTVKRNYREALGG